MKIARCPACHAHIDLEAVVQDEAGRELLAILARLDDQLGPALVQYLGLFRPAKQDLSNARATKLAREVLEMGAGPALREALLETVDAMRAKQAGGAYDRLTNHRYLKKVLASVEARGVVERDVTEQRMHVHGQRPGRASRSAQAIGALQNFGNRKS